MKMKIATLGKAKETANGVSVLYEKQTKDCIECTFTVGQSADDYVFFPAAVYDGNRFQVKKCTYPPTFDPRTDALTPDMPITITDVPRLNADGSGAVELTTGDVSVPCIGVYRRGEGKAYFLWTVQQIQGVNLGLAYSAGKMTVSYPAKRSVIYSMGCMQAAEPALRLFAAGQEVEIPYKFECIECKDMQTFFLHFYRSRTCMALPVSEPYALPDREIVQKILRAHNEKKWCEKLGVYTMSTSFRESPVACWQAGWVSGTVAVYAMLRLGGELERDRAIKSLDFMFSRQTEAGLFYHGYDYQINPFGSGYCDGTKTWLLARVAGDILYYAVRALDLPAMQNTDCSKYDDGLKRLADCLCNIYLRYGQFGYAIDCETAEIAVYGSTSGAVIPAALVAAYNRYGKEEYLRVAQNAGKMLYERDALAGYTTGGPGDILHGPDSESSYGLLESMVSLYEATGERAWLCRAEYAAALTSSWVVAYDYVFPPESTFGKMKMHTAGTVFANIQNKHAAPGFCTYSGDAFARLAAYTGDESYLRLAKQVADAMPQYMSTTERPIYAKLYGNEGNLDDGFLDERVNMSDWESESGVGEIINYSCWSELSLLLSRQ